MILRSLTASKNEIEERTGWAIKPEGACRGEVCVPLPAGTAHDGTVEIPALAERLGMPLVHDAARGLWSLGPDTAVSGRALATAVAPELTLPDWLGETFRLSSLRGTRVLLVAWASW